MSDLRLVLQPVAMDLGHGRIWNGWSWAITNDETVLARSSGYFRGELVARFNAESALRRLGVRQREEAGDA